MPDQAPNDAVELDVDGAADQIETLLDDEESGATESQDRSSQTGENPPEGADEVGGEQGEEQPAETQYSVKVNGEESHVTLDELVRGYQRNADYTSKTQQIAALRREHEAESQAVKQERAQYAHLLRTLDAQIGELAKEPDWESLRTTDPVGYASQWATFQQIQQKRAGLQAEQQRLMQQQQYEEQQRLREHVNRESERLVDAIPQWKDQEKGKAERKSLVEYGMKQGFSADELNNVYDHRAVSILYKAWKYDQAVARRNEAQARAGAAPQTRVLTPGSGTAAKVTEVTRQRQRLAKTGRVEDAAALFERTL